jgi:hypothetical protein
MVSLQLAPSGQRPVPDAPTELADLVAQLGSEVASALTSALERVNALATTGRIDRAGLRALREEIELARLLGIMGQQVSRLASGQVRLTPEPLDLTVMLREALLQRGREIEARGVEVRQRLKPACVMGDATLTYALLQTALDWSFEHTRAHIEFELAQQAWPQRAVLTLRFAHRPVDEAAGAPPQAAEAALATMSWRLLHQTAATLGLPIAREDRPGDTCVTIEFPHTIVEAPAGPKLVLGGHVHAPGGRPLAGSHVLVVAARREVRSRVRESLRSLGLMLDFVTSVDEAREFCRGGMPDAVVHEAALGGEAFERLRRELKDEAATLAFVQITEDGKGFEVRRQGSRELATVAHAAIVEALPTALVYELARSA